MNLEMEPARRRPKPGLDQAEATARLARNGPNIFSSHGEKYVKRFSGISSAASVPPFGVE